MIHHSDQGCQYTSLAFGLRCQEAGVRPSMGSVGDAYDNAHADTLKSDDLFMADARGIISSVIYGSDERTRITPATRQAMFVTYAPAGIGEAAVRRHLEELEAFVRLVAPDATRESLGIWGGPA